MHMPTLPHAHAHAQMHVHMQMHMHVHTCTCPHAHMLRKYVAGTRQLGSRPGRAGLLQQGEVDSIVDVLKRADRGNDGMDRPKAIDTVLDIKPHLSRKQAADTFRMLVQKKHKNELTGPVKAQATTTKRTGITVAQQYRWHMTFECAFDRLRSLNTGIGPGGKTFGEMAEYFVLGGDEACIWAAEGSNKVQFL